MKVCTTVFGYAGGTGIARRHLPIWRAHTDELLLVSPSDSPMTLEGVRSLHLGASGKAGEPTLRRQLFGMQQSLQVDADYYVFLEYDSFLISRPRPRPGLQVCAFADQAPSGFASRWFYHFPWIMDAETLRRFAEEATLDPFEEGYVDRWLSAQSSRLELPVFDLQGANEGYSRNTIRSWWECIRAVSLAAGGAYAFHGVKTSTLLDAILEAARSRRELASIVRST